MIPLTPYFLTCLQHPLFSYHVHERSQTCCVSFWKNVFIGFEPAFSGKKGGGHRFRSSIVPYALVLTCLRAFFFELVFNHGDKRRARAAPAETTTSTRNGASKSEHKQHQRRQARAAWGNNGTTRANTNSSNTSEDERHEQGEEERPRT